MSVLLEDPTPIIVFGILAEAVLGAILVRTRRGVLLWAMGGVLAVVFVVLVVQRLVVTERKRVKATLYGIAAAVERNDQKGVAALVAQSASGLLRQALGYMNQFEFNSVSLRSIEVTTNDLTSPPSAQATFFANVRFTESHGNYPYPGYVGQIWVTLVKEDGQWKVETAQGSNPNPFPRDTR